MKFKKQAKQEMNCKNCKRELSERAYHFSNQIAIERDYCSFACMSGDLGNEEALKVLGKIKGGNK